MGGVSTNLDRRHLNWLDTELTRFDSNLNVHNNSIAMGSTTNFSTTKWTYPNPQDAAAQSGSASSKYKYSKSNEEHTNTSSSTTIRKTLAWSMPIAGALTESRPTQFGGIGFG